MSVLIVGVLNLTPDSFSDGGRFGGPEEAVAAGVAMVDEGADWIDVGGESTRPGSVPVPEAEEIRRVVPVIKALLPRIDGRARISVDTYKAATAEAALAAGATIVNDVSGGVLEPAILATVAWAKATVILGHMRGSPTTMNDDVHFDDVLSEVSAELAARITAARTAGCTEIWADPGIGFGKGLADNLCLLRRVPELRDRLGVPLMLGVSRKGFIGELTGRPAGERLFGTAAAVAAAVLGGAAAVRVHDVSAMRDVVKVAQAIAHHP